MITIERMDHLVLTVRDIEATCRFYGDILGMRVIDFAGGRRALTFGNQKINLHQRGREHEPKAGQPTCGSADICFIAATGLKEIMAHLRQHHISIIAGPVRRSGAAGPLLSIYCRDPDDNLVEIANLLPPDHTTKD